MFYTMVCIGMYWYVTVCIGMYCYVCTCVRTFVGMYVYMYVCMYVFMYVTWFLNTVVLPAIFYTCEFLLAFLFANSVPSFWGFVWLNDATRWRGWSQTQVVNNSFCLDSRSIVTWKATCLVFGFHGLEPVAMSFTFM